MQELGSKGWGRVREPSMHSNLKPSSDTKEIMSRPASQNTGVRYVLRSMTYTCRMVNHVYTC